MNNESVESAVKALLAHDKTTGIFDNAGEIREEWEEGNWVAHPLKSRELQAIIARIEAALSKAPESSPDPAFNK